MSKHRTLMAMIPVLALMLTVSVSTAWAGMVSFNDSVPLQTTNWSDSVSFPKFNDSLPGVPTGSELLSVKITLTGDVEGTARYESLDASPAVITLDLQALIKLQRPDLSQLIQVLPLANVVDNAGVFDTVIDFNGASGGTFDNLSASDTDTDTFVNPVDLALFTGPGNIILPTTAQGASSGSGAGNLILQFATDAGAEVTIEYTFRTPQVPEPASITLAALGLLAMLGRKR